METAITHYKRLIKGDRVCCSFNRSCGDARIEVVAEVGRGFVLFESGLKVVFEKGYVYARREFREGETWMTANL